MQGRQQIPQDEFNQFIISIKSGILEQIDFYLQKYGGQIVNKLENQLRQPPLYFAINLPDDATCLAVLKKLVAKGANAKFKDQNQQTIIFYACRDGKIGCVEYLVSLGVSLYEEDAYGQTPLYYIANQNQLHLIPKYNKPQHYNHSDKLAQQTPLYYAAKKGYLQMCKLLVENGCDISHHDIHNKTAVQYARRARYHQVTQYLSAEAKKSKQQVKSQQVAKDSKGNQQHHVKMGNKLNEEVRNGRVGGKKEMESESVSNVTRSFYKLVYINDQGQTKDLSEEDVRSLVKQKPQIQPLLANPWGISKQALQAEQKQKWQKVAARILNVCWKHKGSIWFLEPVDPVKFCIMDYSDIVAHPMDLGTIKKKLSYNFYSSVQQFAADVKLVWQNCYKYNGYDHEISHCAKQLQQLFNEHYQHELKQYENKTN